VCEITNLHCPPIAAVHDWGKMFCRELSVFFEQLTARLTLQSHAFFAVYASQLLALIRELNRAVNCNFRMSKCVEYRLPDFFSLYPRLVVSDIQDVSKSRPPDPLEFPSGCSMCSIRLSQFLQWPLVLQAWWDLG